MEMAAITFTLEEFSGMGLCMCFCNLRNVLKAVSFKVRACWFLNSVLAVIIAFISHVHKRKHFRFFFI